MEKNKSVTKIWQIGIWQNFFTACYKEVLIIHVLDRNYLSKFNQFIYKIVIDNNVITKVHLKLAEINKMD